MPEGLQGCFGSGVSGEYLKKSQTPLSTTVGPGLNGRDLFHVVKLKKREVDFFFCMFILDALTWTYIKKYMDWEAR
ncbi:hypothetical protein B8W99_19800 [Peribacillus simplex]|nr:hypothetical protein B8W99_19800 [Peribacillus simplex]